MKVPFKKIWNILKWIFETIEIIINKKKQENDQKL